MCKIKEFCKMKTKLFQSQSIQSAFPTLKINIAKYLAKQQTFQLGLSVVTVGCNDKFIINSHKISNIIKWNVLIVKECSKATVEFLINRQI